MKIMSQYWYQTHHYYRIPRNIPSFSVIEERASPKRVLFSNPQNHLWTCTCIQSRPSPTFPAKLTASRIFFQLCSSLPSRASIQRMPTIRSIRYNQMTISDNLRLRASRDFSLERRLSRTILRFVSPIPRSCLLCPHCATMVTSLRITRWRERERERKEKIVV